MSSDREIAFLKSIGVPPSSVAPQERLQQLMATRNERKLYRRKCDATGEDIVSAYPSDSPYTVYKNKIWWGDTWDALEFGRDIDFSRPFFEQFKELQMVVPREGTSVFESENCDYNSHVRNSKNCYLTHLAVGSEDLHYSYWMVNVETTLDSCYHIFGKSSLCYQCVDFSNCYKCAALQECYTCNECAFSYQLRGCKNCLFCSNLVNKEYHIRNKPCSKQEFEKLWNEIFSGSHAQWQKAFAEFLSVRAEAVHRASYLINCENVTGEHMFNTRNCSWCFDGDESEDCSNCISLSKGKDIHSCHSAGWPGCEQIYYSSTSRGSIDMAFCRYMWFCNTMRYCDSCQSSKHGFGCIGLRHKDYCILNKQYSKEEYEKLRDKLVEHMKKTGEWGKFFPLDSLPFAYNESAANDYFPLTREEAIKKGFRWRDVPDHAPEAKKIVTSDAIPDNIKDISDEYLHYGIRCEATGKLFRMIKQELDFYRRMGLPIPRIHPDERHRNRIAMRNPFHLWKRTCANCKKEIQTSYSPERPETIYCEECYLKEVY